jgi:hypothetical protein
MAPCVGNFNMSDTGESLSLRKIKNSPTRARENRCSAGSARRSADAHAL